MVRIIGIDPGSRMTGVAVVDADGQNIQSVCHHTVHCPRGEFADRLRVIFTEVGQIIQQYRPDEVAIETVFMAKNAQSALKLGQARGAAICAAVSAELPVFEYAPRAIKQAVVGKGSADKTQVQYMVRLMLNLNETIQADAADALAACICHANSRWAVHQFSGRARR